MPYFALYNAKPDIINYKNKAIELKKLDPRAKKAILINFRNNLYRLYNINSKRVIQARDVKILKNQFCNFNSNKEADLQVNKESVFDLNQKNR